MGQDVETAKWGIYLALAASRGRDFVPDCQILGKKETGFAPVQSLADVRDTEKL